MTYNVFGGTLNLTLSPLVIAFVYPVFFLNSATKGIILFGCHPLDGVTRGGPPSDASKQTSNSSNRRCCFSISSLSLTLTLTA